MEESPSTARFVIITRMEGKTLKFKTLERGKKHFLSIEGERTFLLTLECFLWYKEIVHKIG
jgi:hypothetical protein